MNNTSVTPLAELESLINRIAANRSDDYNSWFTVGAALHNANPEALYIYKAFSAQSLKYNESECNYKWNNIASNPSDNPRTVATLINLANEDNANNNLVFENFKNLKEAKESIFNIPTNTPAQIQAALFFNSLFADCLDYEFICITNDPTKAKFYRKQEALNKIKEIVNTDSASGWYICCNPLKENRRKKEKVASFKHLLIEFDNLSIEDQKQLLENEKLPAASIVYSGSKSLHLLFKLNAKSLKDYESKAKVVYDYLASKGFNNDIAVKDPCRFTRLAGALRNGKVQQLLSINSGATTNFDEWQQQQLYKEEKAKPLSFITLDDCLNYNEDAVYDNGQVLLGAKYLYRGSALLINAYSGVGKSTLALQMGMQLAAGKNLFGGIPTHEPRKVIVFQAENDADEIKQNYKYIFKNGVENNDFDLADAGLITRNLKVLSEADIGRGATFLAKLKYIIETEKPDLVILDPVFHFYDGSISDQAEVSAFFRGGLHPILSESNTASIIIHHRNKPNKDENKLPFDAQNYTGSGSADLTNWVRAIINLNRYNSDTDLFYLQLAKRGEKAGNGGKTKIFLKRAPDANKPYWFECEAPVEEQEKRNCKSKYDSKGYNYLQPMNEASFKAFVCEKENCDERKYRSYIRASVCANRIIYDKQTHTYTGVDAIAAKEVLIKAAALEKQGLLIENCLEPVENQIYKVCITNNITLN